MNSKSRVLSDSDQKRDRKEKELKKGESFKIVDRTIKDADTYDASRTKNKNNPEEKKKEDLRQELRGRMKEVAERYTGG